jgi:hypothetical protein
VKWSSVYTGVPPTGETREERKDEEQEEELEEEAEYFCDICDICETRDAAHLRSIPPKEIVISSLSLSASQPLVHINKGQDHGIV